MLVVLTLNFFLFEPKFVLVFRLTRLSSSRRLAGMTADLACQMSSCLCQDYNILLLFKHKRDILYTGNIEYILPKIRYYKDVTLCENYVRDFFIAAILLPWFQRFIFIIFIAKGRGFKPLEPGYHFASKCQIQRHQSLNTENATPSVSPPFWQ